MRGTIGNINFKLISQFDLEAQNGLRFEAGSGSMRSAAENGYDRSLNWPSSGESSGAAELGERMRESTGEIKWDSLD